MRRGDRDRLCLDFIVTYLINNKKYCKQSLGLSNHCLLNVVCLQ